MPLSFFSICRNMRIAGIVGVTLGVLHIVLGMLALNPPVLAILIGVWLVFNGLTRLF